MNKKNECLKENVPFQKTADNPKLYFITSVRSKAACFIYRQDRRIWGLQHQKVFSTKDNIFAANYGKEKKKAAQMCVPTNCQAECY